MTPLRRHHPLTPYLFLAPAMGVLGVFFLIATLQVVYFSLTRYTAFQGPVFIGLENYRRALASERFWLCLANSGLYLLVTPTGRRSWALAYRWEGKQRTLPLGKFPAISAAEARHLAEKARIAVDRGEDPGIRTKRAAREKAAVERSRRFDTVAQEWFKCRVETRREPRSAARVWSQVRANLVQPLGDRDVGAITPSDLLDALRKIEARGAVYSAKRIGQYAHQIFRRASSRSDGVMAPTSRSPSGWTRFART